MCSWLGGCLSELFKSYSKLKIYPPRIKVNSALNCFTACIILHGVSLGFYMIKTNTQSGLIGEEREKILFLFFKSTNLFSIKLFLAVLYSDTPN